LRLRYLISKIGEHAIEEGYYFPLQFFL